VATTRDLKRNWPHEDWGTVPERLFRRISSSLAYALDVQFREFMLRNSSFHYTGEVTAGGGGKKGVVFCDGGEFVFPAPFASGVVRPRRGQKKDVAGKQTVKLAKKPKKGQL